jgi:hypothetical protein
LAVLDALCADFKKWSHIAIKLLNWAVIGMDCDIYIVIFSDNVCEFGERNCAIDHVLNG